MYKCNLLSFSFFLFNMVLVFSESASCHIISTYGESPNCLFCSILFSMWIPWKFVIITYKPVLADHRTLLMLGNIFKVVSLNTNRFLSSSFFWVISSSELFSKKTNLPYKRLGSKIRSIKWKSLSINNYNSIKYLKTPKKNSLFHLS